MANGKPAEMRIVDSTFAIVIRHSSGFRFGFAQAGDAVAIFPLATFFENGDALEALHDITFATGGAGGAETAML
jgi:hypothetical protein